MLLYRERVSRLQEDTHPALTGGASFEDNCFWYAQETLVAQGRRIPGDMFHLWHPSARDPDSDAFKRNEARNDLFSAAYGNPEAMRELMAQI